MTPFVIGLLLGLPVGVVVGLWWDGWEDDDVPE